MRFLKNSTKFSINFQLFVLINIFVFRNTFLVIKIYKFISVNKLQIRENFKNFDDLKGENFIISEGLFL